jgi:hypothetical protein
VPYFKCVPCKIRVSATGARTALTEGGCPGCGSALEPVAELTEVIGFRSANLLDPPAPGWLDAGGSLGPEPLPEAVALGLLPPGSR